MGVLSEMHRQVDHVGLLKHLNSIHQIKEFPQTHVKQKHTKKRQLTISSMGEFPGSDSQELPK